MECSIPDSLVDGFLSSSPLVFPDTIPASIHIQTSNGYGFKFTGVKNIRSLVGGDGDVAAFVRQALSTSSSADGSLVVPLPFNSTAQVRANDGTHIAMGQVFRYQDELLLGIVFVIVVYLLVIARLKIKPGIISLIAIPLITLIILILLYVFGFERRIDLSSGMHFTIKGALAIRLKCDPQAQENGLPKFVAEESGMDTSSDFGIAVILDSTNTDLSFITSVANPLVQSAIRQLGDQLVKNVIVPAINNIQPPSQ